MIICNHLRRWSGIHALGQNNRGGWAGIVARVTFPTAGASAFQRTGALNGAPAAGSENTPIRQTSSAEERMVRLENPVTHTRVGVVPNVSAGWRPWKCYA